MPLALTLAMGEAELVQLTLCGGRPFDVTTVAVSWTLSPTCKVYVWGVTPTDVTPKSGSSAFGWRSHAASRAPPTKADQTQLVVKRINPSRARVRFGGSTGMARCVACGSLGALRRRLSPGLPLSSSPYREGRSSRTAMVPRPRNETAALRSRPSRGAGGRADLTTVQVAVVP